MQNKRLLLTFLSVWLWASAVGQASSPSSGEAIELSTSQGSLKGTLLLPAGKKQVPVVLLISGSGPTDRNGNNQGFVNNSLKMVAEELFAQGIASVRYDKRGIGESAAAMVSETELRFDHYVQDAAGWLQKLKKDPRFSKVVVLGHSEGSLIGMIAAREAKADGFISISGSGQSAEKLIRQQLQAQPQLVKDAAFPVLDKLANGETVTEVNPMLAALFRPSVQPYLISWFKYDPQVELKKLNVPVLIIQGKQDIQVPVEEARLLVAALPKAKLVEVEQMNHILKDAPGERSVNIATYSNPTLPLSAPLMPAVVSFVKAIK
jgi:pimeloyl-ACP methyl ester carboxylesterase